MKGERTSKSKSDEFVALSTALKSVNILETTLVNLTKTKAGTFFGTGKISEFISVIEKHEIQLVLIDARLSPMQQRNLERAFKAKVIDRTGLILEIFGDRAQTKEGSLTHHPSFSQLHTKFFRMKLAETW